MNLPTLRELDAMTEQAFDRETERIEARASAGDPEAQVLLTRIDNVVYAAGGTFDLERIPDCEFDFAHTQHWCGNVKCRMS